MIRRCFQRDLTGANGPQVRGKLIGPCTLRFSLGVTAFLLLSGVFFSLPAATLPTGFTETQISGLSGATAMDYVYPLSVEYVGTVPGLSWLTEVVVVLPGSLPTAQDVLVSVTWHARTSNKARITIK
jgi:hypothetical protein